MAERTKNGPYWVKAWIADLSQLTDMFRDEDGKVDYEALGREEYQFRMALARKDFSISVRAKKVWDEAIGPYQQRIGAARKDKESTAGAPTREDGEDRKSGTPATISQDAYGEFGNVVLSQDQFNELALSLGNMNDFRDMVDNLSAKLEDGNVVSKNHYATLKSWIRYRKDMEAKNDSGSGYTSNMEQSWKKAIANCKSLRDSIAM